MLIYISCQSLGSINPYFRTLITCIWRLFLKPALITFLIFPFPFKSGSKRVLHGTLTKSTKKRQYHLTQRISIYKFYDHISKNLIKGKGGTINGSIGQPNFLVWQNSMNTLEKILLGQDPHQLSGISQYILHEIKLF